MENAVEEREWRMLQVVTEDSVSEMADAPASLNLTCGRNEKGEKVV